MRQKQSLVHKVPSGVPILSHVYGVAAKKSTLILDLLGKHGEKRNSCLLLVKKWNGSCHLVFWSLGTLTDLRDRVRGLVV
jgi:hypothetical protein